MRSVSPRSCRLSVICDRIKEGAWAGIPTVSSRQDTQLDQLNFNDVAIFLKTFVNLSSNGLREETNRDQPERTVINNEVSGGNGESGSVTFMQ